MITVVGWLDTKYNSYSFRVSNIPVGEADGGMQCTCHRTSGAEVGHKLQDPVARQQGTCLADFCNPAPDQARAVPKRIRALPCDAEDVGRQLG